MRYLSSGLVLLVWLALPACQKQDRPAEATARPSGAERAASDTKFSIEHSGRLSGRVIFTGKASKPQKLMVIKDKEVCSKFDHTDDRLEFGRDQGIRNAVVSLTAVENGLPLTAMGTEFVIDQRSCRYVPHVLLAPVDTPVRFLNSDGILHNVHTFGKRNRPVNRAHPKHQETVEMTFRRPEMVPVKCDVHGWMSAWIVVVDHPYYAITDDEGRFSLDNIPPGTYTVNCWQELLGEQSAEVTVALDASASIDFEYGE